MSALINITLRFAAIALTSACLLSAVHAQSTITVITTADGPTEGFNDPTPVTPVGGNPGTTLGAQRLFLFESAAAVWAELLNSPVEIIVNAQFSPQSCSPMGSVLGSAGGTTVHADFTNAPVAGVWYSAALASSLAGSDLNGGTPEINTTFNSAIDTGCSGSVGWYYGVDGNPPPDRINLFPVVLHELGHGLGFQTFTSVTTGQFISGTPDIWTQFMFDTEFDDFWINLSQPQRQASAINDPDLVWDGPSVNGAVPEALDPSQQLTVSTPPALAGNYPAMMASYGPPVPIDGLPGDFVFVDDGTAPDATDGCEALTPASAGDVNGNIAVIRRGTCNFTDKTLNAQAAGATAVLIANNVPDGLPPMGGDAPGITIPSIGISQQLGNDIQAQLPSPGVSGVLDYDFVNLAGTTNGFLRLHAPNPVAPGSSVSHWTTAATPSLLMEPAITPDLFDDVDLSLNLFEDIGWSVNFPTEEIFSDSFETIL